MLVSSLNDAFRVVYALETLRCANTDETDTESQTTLFNYSPSAFATPSATSASESDVFALKPEGGQKGLPRIFQEALRTSAFDVVQPAASCSLASEHAQTADFSSSQPIATNTNARSLSEPEDSAASLSLPDISNPPRVRHASETQLLNNRFAASRDVWSATSVSRDALSDDVIEWKKNDFKGANFAEGNAPNWGAVHTTTADERNYFYSDCFFQTKILAARNRLQRHPASLVAHLPHGVSTQRRRRTEQRARDLQKRSARPRA